MLDHPVTGDMLFSMRELECKLSRTVKLDRRFQNALVKLRVAFDRPMSVNSCCRSWEHNKAEGGHIRSLHVYDEPFHDTRGAMAIDIRTPNSKYAYELCFLAMRHEWAVGYNAGFLHLDRRVDLGMGLNLIPTAVA